MIRCPFCKQDPYHYVDNGVGMEAVAINCCDLMIGLHDGVKQVRQFLNFRRSHSPRKKARAQRILAKLEEAGWCIP